MGNVEILCEKCEGKRFDNEMLEVTYKGKNIFDILDMYISEAREFFTDQPGIMRFLEVMNDLGLGYLKLGQRSTTLSGGEAQRVKLATELAFPHSAHTLYILDEPTTGLHQADVRVLLSALDTLILQGNTIILVEHHLGVIAASDHVIDLGPGSGKEGGSVVATGTPEEIAQCSASFTGQALKEYMELQNRPFQSRPSGIHHPAFNIRYPGSGIHFTGISTNNLQNVSVEIPHNKVTVVTGVSGSGKSSLAYDTVFAEGRNRFLESFSSYARTRLGMKDKPDFEEVSGLTPTLAVDQRMTGVNPRSTVGTMTGIYDLYRLFMPGSGNPFEIRACSFFPFSFNHQHGACPKCDGLGTVTVCDPGLLVTHPEINPGRCYGWHENRKILWGSLWAVCFNTKAVGKSRSVDFSLPWQDLPEHAKNLAMAGAGEEIFDVTWEYRRNKREGRTSFQRTLAGVRFPGA